MVTKDFLMGFGAGKAQGGGGSSVSVEPLSVSANGAYTAPTGKAYSPVNVNVPNSYAASDEGKVVDNGALVAQTTDTVTQNGTVDTTLINSLIVNVSGGGGGGLEYETGSFTPTADISSKTIEFANTHTKAPMFIQLADANSGNDLGLNYIVCWTYIDTVKMFGFGFPYTSNSVKYGFAEYIYRGSSNVQNSRTFFSYPSTSDVSDNKAYPRYWATESGFYAYADSSGRYFMAGRTYKWIAVWEP